MLTATNTKIPNETRAYIKSFEDQLAVLISKIQQDQEYSHLNCEMSCTLAEAPDDQLPYKNTYNANFSTYGSQGFQNIIEQFFEERKESLGDKLPAGLQLCADFVFSEGRVPPAEKEEKPSDEESIATFTPETPR